MSISLLYIQESQLDKSGRLGIQVGIFFIDLDEEAIGSLNHDIASKGFVEDGMISLEPLCWLLRSSVRKNRHVVHD